MKSTGQTKRQAIDLVGLIDEAAADSSGVSHEPGLIALLRRCRDGKEEGLRAAAITQAVNFIKQRLADAARGQQVTFLQFLSEAELVPDSPRLREALIRFVEQHLPSLSKISVDVLTIALKAGVAPAVASHWYSVVAPRHRAAPTWNSLDALAALAGRATDYDRSALLADVQRLRQQDNFVKNVQERKHKWARLDLLVSEVLSTPKRTELTNGKLNDFFMSVTQTQGSSSHR